MTLKSRWPLLFIVVFSLHFFARAVDSSTDYLEPKELTGTIYSDASLKQSLFTFRRSATNSGSTVRVLREFNLPNGTIAARERIVYESGRLKSFSLEELQSAAKGSAVVQSTADQTKLNFDYYEGTTRKRGSEKFLNQILVSDMVVPFMIVHWEALTGGAVIPCRLVSVSHVETVGFKFFKESETTWHGEPALIVKMEPSSIIIAQLVAPLHFVMEKAGPHRVFQYTGRTTPSILRDGKWQDLDAVTVFDWK